jgi:hypothetical protein
MGMAIVSNRRREMNRDKFALYSFERDLKAGCFKDEEGTHDEVKVFDDLDVTEQEDYLEEADFYLAIPEKDRELGGKDNPGWPEDILMRMKAEKQG